MNCIGFLISYVHMLRVLNKLETSHTNKFITAKWCHFALGFFIKQMTSFSTYITRIKRFKYDNNGSGNYSMWTKKRQTLEKKFKYCSWKFDYTNTNNNPKYNCICSVVPGVVYIFDIEMTLWHLHTVGVGYILVGWGIVVYEVYNTLNVTIYIGHCCIWNMVEATENIEMKI